MPDPFRQFIPEDELGRLVGLRWLIQGEVWLVSTRRRVKASDISDLQVMSMLWDNRGRWTQNWDLVQRFRLPWKVVNAKMNQLKKRGLVDGCGCGCKGDWEILPLGVALLNVWGLGYA